MSANECIQFIIQSLKVFSNSGKFQSNFNYTKAVGLAGPGHERVLARRSLAGGFRNSPNMPERTKFAQSSLERNPADQAKLPLSTFFIQYILRKREDTATGLYESIDWSAFEDLPFLLWYLPVDL